MFSYFFYVDIISLAFVLVNDGSGNISVVTGKSPPAKEVKVNVTGTVNQTFTLGDKTQGTVVNETKRE
jgi:hypothetical protein